MTDRPNIHDIEALGYLNLLLLTIDMAAELGRGALEIAIARHMNLSILQRISLDLADQLRARDVDRGPWREELAALEGIKTMIENQQPLPEDVQQIAYENRWDLYSDEAAEGEE